MAMSEKETVKETRRVTRVALRPATEKIIEGWRETLRITFPSFSSSLSDLVAWAVERTPALSKKDIQEIRRLFFDEVKELEALLSQLKTAKANGDEEVLRRLLVEIKGKRTSSSRKKAASDLGSENAEITAS